MKTIVVVGLLCLVAIATSYPLEANQPGQDGRVLRRRNQQENPVANPNRNRQVKPAARPQKQRYTPEETAPSAFQERYASPVSPKRKASPVEARESIRNEPDYESAASGGSYDEGAAKFEQGVQNSASSYNSDQGVKDGRVQFAISGQQGPHSYRFGYDTGKGADRTFRIEERDAQGVIHGRYGYYDPSGKFRIVNYSAHPEHGFQAEGNFASN